MAGLKSELDQLDTEVLVRYAVEADECSAALAVVDKFRHHRAAYQLLRSYYIALPEGREEMAVDLRVVNQHQGTYLFVLKTTKHHYLYLGSETEALYLNEFSRGLKDEGILGFFGYANAQTFSEQVPDHFADLQPLGPTDRHDSVQIRCVACDVAEGEKHILGCPVEQCPWCAAQLNRCNCRFDQLGVDRIDDEYLVDRFEELLEQKGRIVFKAIQNPSYPVAGNDPAPGELNKQDGKKPG